MRELVVYRVLEGGLVHVGNIFHKNDACLFMYADEYLGFSEAIPLSLSLPFRTEPFTERELRPYFEGLLPEGRTREAIAAQLGAPENDYLTLLGASGLDCIGDVVVREAGEGDAWDEGSYVPLSTDELQMVLTDFSSQAKSNAEVRLSLAGTQGKVGLAHWPDAPIGSGWARPINGAASTHILKVSNLSRISEFEVVCVHAAEACGIRVAHTDALMLGAPTICSERYDRSVSISTGALCVTRLHQEDFAQAFGVTSRAKYSELDGGTYHAIAQLLYEHSSFVLQDLDQLMRIAVFDYLIGNCDNHLKNLSIVREGMSVRLAPAYDLVCTTFFERFSREMGKRLGSTRAIDSVTPKDFDLLARDLGVGSRRMKRVCREMSEMVVQAIFDAGEKYLDVFPALPYVAEDLVDDMEPRLAVVVKAAG